MQTTIQTLLSFHFHSQIMLKFTLASKTSKKMWSFKTLILAQLFFKQTLMNLTHSIWMRIETLIEQRTLRNMLFTKLLVLAFKIWLTTLTSSAITTTVIKELWRILRLFNTQKNLPILVKRHQWKSDTKTGWPRFSISYDLRQTYTFIFTLLNEHYIITEGKTGSNY